MSQYIDKLVEKFRLMDAVTVDTPMPVGWEAVGSPTFTNNKLYRELVGQLMYINVVGRPDVSFAVNVLARAVEMPTVAHWNLGR